MMKDQETRDGRNLFEKEELEFRQARYEYRRTTVARPRRGRTN